MVHNPNRRTVVAGLGSLAAGFGLRPQRAEAQPMNTTADLILFNGKITTLDRQNPRPTPSRCATAASSPSAAEREVMALAGPDDEARRPARAGASIPGLIDSHTHIIRGGLNYNMELRWDGVRSLADAMRMLKEQVDRTPPPQWVRVVGGFTEHQFAEKRLPTLDEINAVAPDTPVFILHLYDRALLNGAALRAVGYTKDTPNPPGGEIAARRARQPDRPAARQAERHDPLRDARQGPEAAARVPEELDPPLHARDQPARRHQRHRRRRRLPELSRRLPDHRGAAQRRAAHGAHRLQPVHPEAEGGARRLHDAGPSR